MIERCINKKKKKYRNLKIFPYLSYKYFKTM